MMRAQDRPFSGDSAVTAGAQSIEQQGSASGAPVTQSCALGRLLDLRQAAAYLHVSYWVVRDMVQNGTLPAVRLPATRIDTAPRRNGKPTRRQVLPAGDARLGSMRRILLDVRDLDALIERSKECQS